MIVLKIVGIFYLVCTAIAIPLFAYAIKHAEPVPQEIDIYEL